MADKARVAWLDVAKGWSILCVAFYHSTIYLSKYDLASTVFEDLNSVLMPVRMPLFFAVSGILAASSIQYSWPALVEKRLYVFAYLLIVWTAIRWAFFSTVMTNINSPTEGSSLFELIEFWIAPSTGLWFIWALGIYFVLGKLGFRFKRSAYAVVCVVSVSSYVGLFEIDNFAQQNAVRYAPFFLTGAWFGRSIVRWLVPRYVFVGVFSALAFLAMTLGMVATAGPVRGLLQMFASISGLAMGASVSVLLSNSRMLEKSLGYVGRNTLPIYVAHVLIVAGVAAILASVAAELPMIELWAVPLTMTLSVVVALLIEAVCKRVGLWWLYTAPPLPACPVGVSPHRLR